MDLADLISELRSGASYPREQDIVATLEGLTQSLDVPQAQREVHLSGELASLAHEIVTLFWGGGLSRDACAYLEVVADQRWTPAEIVAGMIDNGIASTAVHLAPGRTVWVPVWLAGLGAQRAGVDVQPIAARWAIPVQWPVPVHQVKLNGMSDYDALARRLLSAASLREPLVGADPRFPDEWLVSEGHDLPLRDDLMTLLELDGHAGMRLLLSSFGSPLSGFAHQIAALALQGHAALKARGRPWSGVIAYNQQIGIYEDTIVALPGWMSASLMSLGLSLPAAPNQLSEAAEEQLIERGGGAIVNGQGSNLHIFPRNAGAIVRRLAVDWSAVPRI